MAILTHRRHNKNLGPHVMLFAETADIYDDSAPNWQYGEHCWVLETELKNIDDCPEIAQFAAEYYGIDIDESEELVNPDNIVDSARAWDDEGFCYECFEKFGIVGFRTYDGAVVLDKDNVDLRYELTKDDDDDDEL